MDHNLTVTHLVKDIAHWPIENWSDRYQGVKGTFIPTGLSGLNSLPFVFPPYTSDSISAGLARSNPSRPVVDLPVFLAELRELPRLIHFAGASILKRRPGGAVTMNPEVLANFKKKPYTAIAGANLNYHFGWAPLVGDVLKLIEFGEHIDQRVKILKRLYSGKGLKRRVFYRDQSYSTAWQVQNNVETASGTLHCWRRQTSKRKTWLTARWKPTSPPPVDEAGYQWRAIRATLGLDLTMSTVWELIPFSWLVDWFSDVGDVLMSHRNTIPAVPSRVNIMWTDEDKLTYAFHSGSAFGQHWRGATITRTTLNRLVGNSGTTSGHVPFLDMRQLSILGSLSVLQADAWQRRK